MFENASLILPIFLMFFFFVIPIKTLDAFGDELQY